MHAILLKLFTNALIQRLILLGLKEAAARTDNTIDDKVVAIVQAGFDSRINPIQRAGVK
jgi:hypothetical protein